LSRLVFITQRVDPQDPVLAATVAKIAALAERVDELAVIARHAAPAALPGNVRVRSFDARRKPVRAVRFARALAAELRRRPDAVIAHMIPLYAILAGLAGRPLGIRVLLWYSHWKAHLPLRLAERLVDGVVSVERRSFPLPSSKLTAIGHGIDVREFPCRAPGANGTLRLLVLGRYSPAKGLDVVLRGLRGVLDRGLDARLEVHGVSGSALEQSHRRELERLVGELRLDGNARLEGPVPRTDLPALFTRADLLVNNMRSGAPDKVVYEACVGCLPVLASNPVFDDLFTGLEQLSFARESADELATRLEAFAALDESERARIGRTLRERVAERHSVERWAEGLLAAATR
jgi:glycosyltransferase involved in cell wall biosynthesis